MLRRGCLRAIATATYHQDFPCARQQWFQHLLEESIFSAVGEENKEDAGADIKWMNEWNSKTLTLAVSVCMPTNHRKEKNACSIQSVRATHPTTSERNHFQPPSPMRSYERVFQLLFFFFFLLSDSWRSDTLYVSVHIRLQSESVK